MPQCDVFHRWRHRHAHQPGQAGEVFCQHRIALVRHRRRALLALGEILFGFQNLGALQMADFGGDALDRGGDDAKRGEIHRMAVARDDLGRDRFGGQAHGLGDMLFNARINVGEGADRARDGAGGDFRARIDQASTAAVEFRIGFRHFQTEGHRLGVDAVRAADGDGVLVLIGATLDGGQKCVDRLKQDIGRLGELDGETGIENVRRRHPLMDETGLVAHMLGQIGEKRDDVMLGFALDLVDAVDVEGHGTTLFPDGLCGLLGDDAEVGEGVAGMGLDLEPDAKLCFGRPDRDHFRAGVARYHGEIRGYVALRRV